MKLHSPVRTFNTAVTYYHRFRLIHQDNEYSITVCLNLFFAPGS